MTARGYSRFDRKKVPQLLMAALVIFAVNLRADSGASRHSVSVSPNVPSIVFVEAPNVASVTGADRFPDGSRIALLVLGAKGKSPATLTNEFFAAADPQIDFSGKHILFTGQKVRGDRWQIWEMNVDGSGARQITKCVTDCLRPAYLPGDEIAFTSIPSGADSSPASLEVIGLDGSNVHAITFGPGGWWLETVLRDGRMVASANAPLIDVAPGNTNRLLYTLRPDGTGLESLRCEHNGRAVRGEASELEDGSIIYTETGGALMLVRRGAVHEERIGTPGTSYHSPNALEHNAIVVARKAIPDQRYELSIIMPSSTGQGRTIYSSPKLDSLEPVAVIPRPTPIKFWSNLVPGSPTGYFISLDSSNSMDKSQNASAIRRVRVIEQKPSGEAVLGEAMVEADGSFYVQVPANQAVRFVLLDDQGKLIREERGWIWTRPGEQRGCTGCHGDKAVAPNNRWPMVLRKQEPPTRLTGAPNEMQTVESHDH